MAVTPLEYALLAVNAYSLGNQVPPTAADQVIKSAQNTIPTASGWQRLDAYTRDDGDGLPAENSGFLAGVYLKGDEVVISFAGTTAENVKDWLYGNVPSAVGFPAADMPDAVDLSWLGSDFNFADLQVTKAARLYLDVLDDPALRSKHISFTGHSLGGGLASLMAVYFDRPATVFDEAPFSKSADLGFVVQGLKNQILLEQRTVPAALDTYPTDRVGAVLTRVQRQEAVSSISVKGEVLSLIDEKDLLLLGSDRDPLYELAEAYILTHPDEVVSFVEDAVDGVIDLAVEHPFITMFGGLIALWAAPYVSTLAAALPKIAKNLTNVLLTMAGEGIGKIHGPDDQVFDLHATADSNLNWGWIFANEFGVMPDPVDLHSMALVVACLQSPSFVTALQTHLDLLPSLFANEDFPNRPDRDAPTLLELLVQRQLNGGQGLDVLAAEIGKIDLADGVTALRTDPFFKDGIYASAVLTRVVLAGLYEQARHLRPDDVSPGPLSPVLSREGDLLRFELPSLGAQASKLLDDLARLINLQGQWRGHDLAAADFQAATWVVQSGDGAISYDANVRGDAQAVLLGGPGDDKLFGTSQGDLLSGNDGADTIQGLGGNDRLVAFGGDDVLYGGRGDDAYFVNRVEHDPVINLGTPTYEIWDTEGQDILTIGDITSPFSISGIDDLNFKADGNDLWIDLDIRAIGVSDADDGRIVIHNQSDLDQRVESLALIDDKGGQIGASISLASVWSVLKVAEAAGDTGWQRLLLSGTVGEDGALVQFPNGNDSGQSTSHTSARYDLTKSLDAALLSLAAYDSGFTLAAGLQSHGWKPLSNALLDAGGGYAAEGKTGSGKLNAYAFTASRELPGNTVQYAIAFRGTDDGTDWLDTNASRWGFSSYYANLRPVMVEFLKSAADAKLAGKNVELLITGHSLGGAAAQAALADLLLEHGKDLWSMEAGQSSTLDVAHRIWSNPLVAQREAVIRELAQDATAITFGAPSLLIDAEKPPSPGLALTAALAPLLVAPNPALAIMAAVADLAALLADSLVVDNSRSLNATPQELLSLQNHLFQYEHEDSDALRAADPVASLGTEDPGMVFDINLETGIHDRYNGLASWAIVAMHTMNGYLESLGRAVSGAPLLKSPNDLANSSPLPPGANFGTPENDLIIGSAFSPVSGGSGNDLMLTGDAQGNYTFDGGVGVDTYVLRAAGAQGSDLPDIGGVNAIIDGPAGEAVDHLIFSHEGSLSADVKGDNVVLTLTSSTLSAPLKAVFVGWYSGLVPYQVATIEQVVPRSDGFWGVETYSFRELGVPYYLTGTDANDGVLGSHLDDARVLGGLGDDSIEGREGSDRIYGDQESVDPAAAMGGNDSLDGGQGHDTLYGGAGHDNLNGGPGLDVLVGGIGDDLLDAGIDTDQDFLYGNDGADRLTSRGGQDRLSGGAGNDFYSVEGTDNVWVFVDDAGSGFDTLRIRAPGAVNAQTRFVVAGTTLEVRLNDASGTLIRGLDLLDMVNVAGRIELLEIDQGNADASSVGRFDLNVAWTAAAAGDATGGKAFLGTFEGGRYLGDGHDVINGTPGADWLDGLAGDDTIDGRAGSDRIWGGVGADVLSAGSGSDTLDGGSDDDVLTVVVDGVDQVTGGLGTDHLNVDASAWGDVGFGSIFWGGKRADGSAVAAVDFNASFDAVNTFLGAASMTVIYATYAQRNIFGQPTGLEASGAVTLSFSGVEFIDSFLAGRAVAGSDLVIARNPGTFDGGLGNDKLYADLSAFTGDVSLDASSDQPCGYAGYDFKDFEAFLVSTGPGNDSVDTSAFAIADYFKLGAGHNTARTGGGNDVILTSGNGVATIDSGAGNVRSSAAWATTTSPPATAPTTSPATTATTRSSWARAAQARCRQRQ
ncbi:MAG: hypothetical protein U1F56_10835 [Rubrivivax sp.]